MRALPSTVKTPAWQDGIPRIGLRRLRSPEVGAILIALILWEAVGRLLEFPFFPPFTRVIAAGAILIQKGAIGSNLLASLSSLTVGFALAVVTGITVGAAMGRFPLVDAALGPYVNALLAAPGLIYAPILFTFLGVGMGGRVAVVFLYAVFIIIVNTATAVRTVEPQLVEMARSFGARGPQLFWRVVLPDALPLTIAGVRLGVNRAFKGTINGEMLIAFVGLGVQLRRYGSAFDVPSVLAILLVVVIAAALASWVVETLDRRLTWWADWPPHPAASQKPGT